jgi:HAD superfamily hydrolase (TIGR01509 family)
MPGLEDCFMTKPTSRALLFDIDGTLTDTDALHLDAFNQVFGPYGHIFDHARFSRELQGFSMASIQQRFLAGESPEQQLAVMERKETVFRDLAAAQIRPLPGLMALLDVADRAGVPMAAVTNAPRLNAEMMLAGLGIADRFAVLVIGDELAHGKPHPLPYLEGLRALGADPEASVAFEDSRAGAQAASAAGIATVGIRTSVGHDDLVAAGAVTTAKSFDAPELLGWLAERMKW